MAILKAVRVFDDIFTLLILRRESEDEFTTLLFTTFRMQCLLVDYMMAIYLFY